MRRGVCAASRGDASHLATGFGAFAAGFSALLAVIHFVLRALRAAGIADLGAKLTGAFGELGAARHLARAMPAHVCAAPIEFNAAGHHFDVILVQTRSRTVFALYEAVVARLKAVLIFFVSHIPILLLVVERRMNVALDSSAAERGTKKIAVEGRTAAKRLNRRDKSRYSVTTLSGNGRPRLA